MRSTVVPPPRFEAYAEEPVSQATRNVMAANRGKDTKPEMALRRALWARGARYRCHPRDVPGWPDVCHKGARVAVFVDGCFWHGCPQHFKIPKTRSEFWLKKIERNKEKRRRVLEALAPDWTVFQFYECELKGGVDQAAEEVLEAMEHIRREGDDQ